MLIIRAILLLIFLLPINALANGESQPSIQVNTQQNNKNPAVSTNEQPNKNESTSKLLKSPLIEEITKQQNQKPQSYGKQGYQWSKNILEYLFEFLLTVFTGFLALFTYRLWKANISLWEAYQEHSKHLEKSVSIARESADAANRSAKVAEKTLIIGKRAFVFTDEIRAVSIPSEPGLAAKWRITAILKNAGETPTQKMMMNINWKHFKEEIPEDFNFPDASQPPVYGFIGPKSFIHSCHVDIPIPLIEKAAFVGDHKIYIWGWVDYNDVFEGTPRRRTEFCYEILSESVPEKALIGFRLHRKYNGADDECYRKPSPYVRPV